jgi:hypothetical protein
MYEIYVEDIELNYWREAFWSGKLIHNLVFFTAAINSDGDVSPDAYPVYGFA